MSKLVDLKDIIDKIDIKQLNSILCRDNIEIGYLDDMKEFKFSGVVYMDDHNIKGILIHTDMCLYPFIVILLICSDPKYKSEKIGTFLMDYMKKYTKKMKIPYLIAHISRNSDIFYKKMDFIKMTRKNVDIYDQLQFLYNKLKNIETDMIEYKVSNLQNLLYFIEHEYSQEKRNTLKLIQNI